MPVEADGHAQGQVQYSATLPAPPRRFPTARMIERLGQPEVHRHCRHGRPHRRCRSLLSQKPRPSLTERTMLYHLPRLGGRNLESSLNHDPRMPCKSSRFGVSPQVYLEIACPSQRWFSSVHCIHGSLELVTMWLVLYSIERHTAWAMRRAPGLSMGPPSWSNRHLNTLGVHTRPAA
jgi:hypothetical protein